MNGLTEHPEPLEAEKGFLSSWLQDKELGYEAGMNHKLNVSDFLFPLHQALFLHLCEVYRNKSAVSDVTLRDLMKQEQFGDIEALEYLAHLSLFVPTAANADYYASIIREQSDALCLQ